jgi:hypothetical protein
MNGDGKMSTKSESQILRTWVVLLAALAFGIGLRMLSTAQGIRTVGPAVVSPAQADINWN